MMELLKPTDMTYFYKYLFVSIFALTFVSALYGENKPPLVLNIKSSQNLNGIAGDYVTVKSEIMNTGVQPVVNVITYLSLVDNENKLPVDLEDWSAEKGVYIPIIKAGKTMPLNFKIHFVKAGDYSLIVIASAQKTETPIVSRMIHFHVSPKINLNPGKILPVAIGMPLLLLLILGSINYMRKRHQ
jgi:hypothetical protein